MSGPSELITSGLSIECNYCSQSPIEQKECQQCGEIPPIPPGTRPLHHQVSGHRHGEGKTKLGFLESDDGCVLKPVQSPPGGMREVQFYQEVFSQHCSCPVLLSLRPLLPKFMGIFSYDLLPNVEYLKLEDVAYPFNQPCIADLKMGPINYDPEADAVKIKRKKNKYPPLEKVGFQLTGMRIYKHSTGTYDCYDKIYGRSLSAEQMLTDGLAVYFNQGNGVRKDAVRAFLRKLKVIEDWFVSQRKYSIYASSLLFVYEGLPSSDLAASNKFDEQSLSKQSKNKASQTQKNIASVSSSNKVYSDKCEGLDSIEAKDKEVNPTNGFQEQELLCDDLGQARVSQSDNVKKMKLDSDVTQCTPLMLDQPLPHVDVRIIDLVHVFPTTEEDKNYLTGLRNLMEYLKRLLE